MSQNQLRFQVKISMDLQRLLPIKPADGIFYSINLVSSSISTYKAHFTSRKFFHKSPHVVRVSIQVKGQKNSYRLCSLRNSPTKEMRIKFTI